MNGACTAREIVPAKDICGREAACIPARADAHAHFAGAATTGTSTTLSCSVLCLSVGGCGSAGAGRPGCNYPRGAAAAEEMQAGPRAGGSGAAKIKLFHKEDRVLVGLQQACYPTGLPGQEGRLLLLGPLRPCASHHHLNPGTSVAGQLVLLGHKEVTTSPSAPRVRGLPAWGASAPAAALRCPVPPSQGLHPRRQSPSVPASGSQTPLCSAQRRRTGAQVLHPALPSGLALEPKPRPGETELGLRLLQQGCPSLSEAHGAESGRQGREAVSDGAFSARQKVHAQGNPLPLGSPAAAAAVQLGASLSRPSFLPSSALPDQRGRGAGGFRNDRGSAPPAKQGKQIGYKCVESVPLRS